MAVMKIKDANGNWQNIVALKGDRGERGPEGPVGPAGGVTSVNGMTGDVTIESYTLPTASSNTLGGVKVGSNITNSSGTISLTSSNVTSALGYTPLSSSGTAAKATADASGNDIANTYMKKSSITSSTTDLTAGTSTLATGSIYLVYE